AVGEFFRQPPADLLGASELSRGSCHGSLGCAPDRARLWLPVPRHACALAQIRRPACSSLIANPRLERVDGDGQGLRNVVWCSSARVGNFPTNFPVGNSGWPNGAIV